MYKEQTEIISSWKDFLAGNETKAQSAIKKILNKTVGNKDIYAMFFEYEYDYMDIVFFALDNKENVLVRDLNTINEEINCKHLFPDNLSDREMEISDEYDGEDDNFDDYITEYNQEKEKILKEWFISCWDKICREYDNIPQTFFSIHDTNYKYNLSTKEEIKDNEIFK
jgi:hypothetical protein